MNSHNPIVAIAYSDQACEYPVFPFAPSERYPEFQSKEMILDRDNNVYGQVRESLYLLWLDAENFWSSWWNPFKDYISKWGKVVIKPNLVFHTHPSGEAGVISMISHASVIRPIIDYILLATWGDVYITICDVPLQSANWNDLIRISWLEDMTRYFVEQWFHITLSDFRYEIATQSKEWIIISRDHKVRDPLWYTAVDIWKESALMDIMHESARLEITDYPLGTVWEHHNGEKNEYLIPNTVLTSDLFINVPKLKTHRKAWMTFAMKNLVGINGDKSWIAHHRKWSQSSGWDEYISMNFFAWLKSSWVTYLKQTNLWRWMARGLYWVYRGIYLKWEEPNKVYARGESAAITEWSWYGNDTIWRCIKDLNSIIIYANKEWVLCDTPQRKYLSIWDGIIAGEKEWPMLQTPKITWCIIAGFNSVAVDRVAASIMGFDYQKIPQIARSFDSSPQKYKICSFAESEIQWRSNRANIKDVHFDFIPTVNWQWHIERQDFIH